jgi:two-component sensor histidine kinase
MRPDRWNDSGFVGSEEAGARSSFPDAGAGASFEAIGSQTIANSTNADDFKKKFSQRIGSLSRSLDLISRGAAEGTSLVELIRKQLEAYLDERTHRVTIEGPAIQLGSEQAQQLGMAIHELATNAAKYGSLSVAGGRIDIQWALDQSSNEPVVVFKWSEHDGPHTQQPVKKGFGSVAIERLLAQSLNANVTTAYQPEGFRLTVLFPLSHLNSGLETSAVPAKGVAIVRGGR